MKRRARIQTAGARSSQAALPRRGSYLPLAPEQGRGHAAVEAGGTTAPLPPGAPGRFAQWARRFGLDGLAELHGTKERPTRQLLLLGGILVVAAVCLTILEYKGASNRCPAFWMAAWSRLGEALEAQGAATLASLFDGQLVRLGWWSGSCFVFYFLLPALYVKFLLRRPLSEFGLARHGLTRHLPVYLVLFLLVLPAVIGASFSPAFQRTYPFYHDAHRSLLHLVAWELLYAQQFFSLEFFFRGFLVHGLRPGLGLLSIPVMVVPYCMIHFGKPLPEALAAILAGLVLGVLSLATRSIWCGVLIHASVALTMDLLALGHAGRLGGLF